MGVNKYVNGDPDAAAAAEGATRSIDGSAVREQQLRKLAAVKAGRDEDAAQQALMRLEAAGEHDIC